MSNVRLSPEEIEQRRQEKLQQLKHEKEAKLNDSKWLKDNNIIINYHTLYYKVGNKAYNTTISSGCRIQQQEDNTTEIDIKYLILSPKDNFSRPFARKMLRLAFHIGLITYKQNLMVHESSTTVRRNIKRIVSSAIEYNLITRQIRPPGWLKRAGQDIMIS